MNFESDLAHIIKRQFDEHNIVYKAALDALSLTARYLEMLNRRIVPIPRKVHFSEEIQDSLGALRRKADMEQRKEVADAWGTVFFIRNLLTQGKDVNGFLGTGINHATGRMSEDGLLWDFGMHHFHLNRQPHKKEQFRQKGFLGRSDDLLFTIITQEHAYFVDIRPHPNRQNLGWVRQDLLKIVHSNWPALIESSVLRGVKGTVLTDEEKQELRRKNTNHAAHLGGSAVAPLGGGTMSDGSSLLCRVWALKLLRVIKDHQCYFDSQPAELRSGLEAKGIELDGRMEFELVLVDSVTPSAEVTASLTEDKCLSRDLYQMGFMVVEATTRAPIAVSLERPALPTLTD